MGVRGPIFPVLEIAARFVDFDGQLNTQQYLLSDSTRIHKMPFTVRDLLVDKVKPVCVHIDDSLKSAVTLMMDGDYSQLPVVDDKEGVAGLITSDSIVRALCHLRLKIDELRVDHALRPVPKTYSIDDEIFELLDGLRDAYAVIVVDGDRKVFGIVTNYDTASYFRSRAEDMMLVEDIETTLKDCIRTDLLKGNEDQSDESLMVAVGGETDGLNSKEICGRAIARAIEILNASPTGSQKAELRQLIDEIGSPESRLRRFSDLTLNQYISLFLEKGRWEKFGQPLKLPINSCRQLLEGVRVTRNDLFHFRTELSADRRDELKYCRDWLNKNQQLIIDALKPVGARDTEPATLQVLIEDNARSWDAIKQQVDEALQVEPQLIDKPDAETSKYSRIAVFLQTVPHKVNSVLVTFEEVETIIESELPRAAYEHRSWWANDAAEHVQSKQWLEVGWRVSNVNISQQRATFTRIKDREQSYISFFSSLLESLRNRELELKNISPSGKNFLPMDGVRSETNDLIAFVGCSFARGGQFRVELYIDAFDHNKNKYIFDGLKELGDVIERQTNWPLQWEELPGRRAFRIAAYHKGSITDPADELEALLKWATDMTSKFYKIFLEELNGEIVDLEIKADVRVSPELYQ